MNTVARRTVLSAAVATPAVAAVAGPAAGATPYNLPWGVNASLQSYRNWAGTINTAPVWTTTVSSRRQLLDLVNWAGWHDWRIRPTGFRHTWSPVVVENGENRDTRVMVVNTRSALTGISVRDYGSYGQVRVGAGESMENLLRTLDRYGFGFANVPAPGDITVGGAMALACHGTSIPAAGESLRKGLTYGTLSNAIMSMRALIYDPYYYKGHVSREISRSQYEAGVLTAHLGRSLITDFTLRVGRQPKLRCVSYTNIPGAELLGNPTTGARTLDSFLRQAGRVEVLWFPFTESPWLKVWSEADTQPAGSRATNGPYNYVFADDPANQAQADAVDLKNYPERTPAYTQGSFQAVVGALDLTGTRDLWGPAYHTQLYVRPSAVRNESTGHAIVCRRADVQKVLATATQIYTGLLQSFQAAGRYPVNGPLEIRLTGIDRPSDSLVSGARDVWLSPARRVAFRPDLDTVIWIGALTQPGTPGADDFFRQLEVAFYNQFATGDTVMRVEWSKAWAFTTTQPWEDERRLDTDIPQGISAGQQSGSTFTNAASLLYDTDPYRLVQAPLHQRLLSTSTSSWSRH